MYYIHIHVNVNIYNCDNLAIICILYMFPRNGARGLSMNATSGSGGSLLYAFLGLSIVH